MWGGARARARARPTLPLTPFRVPGRGQRGRLQVWVAARARSIKPATRSSVALLLSAAVVALAPPQAFKAQTARKRAAERDAQEAALYYRCVEGTRGGVGLGRLCQDDFPPLPLMYEQVSGSALQACNVSGIPT